MNGGEEQTPILARLDRRLPHLYLLFALPLTTLLCFLTAPFFGPDESAQSLRAISLSHGHLIEQMGPKEPGGDIDANVVLVMDGVDDIRMAWEPNASNFHDRPWGPMRAQPQQRLAAIRWAHHIMWEPFGNTAVYPPLLYFPSITGWRIGEALSLTVFDSMRLARLFCSLTAIALGWLALRLCACSRWILLPFLILPSTLFLNATASQDAILLLRSRPRPARPAHSPPGRAPRLHSVRTCPRRRTPRPLCHVPPTLRHPGARALSPHRRTPPPRPASLDRPHRSLRRRRWPLPPLVASRLSAPGPDLRRCRRPRSPANPVPPRASLRRSHSHDLPAEAAGSPPSTSSTAASTSSAGTTSSPTTAAAPSSTVALVLILLLAPACPIRTRLGLGLLALAVLAPLLGNSLAEYIIWTTPAATCLPSTASNPATGCPRSCPSRSCCCGGRLRRSPLHLRTHPRTHRLLLAATAALVLVACTLPWMAAHAFYTDTVAHVLLRLP